MRSVQVVEREEDVEDLPDGRALLAAYATYERDLRLLQAHGDRLLEKIDRTGAYAIDADLNAKGFVNRITRCGSTEAHQAVRIARLRRCFPRLTAMADEGLVPRSTLLVAMVRAAAAQAANAAAEPQPLVNILITERAFIDALAAAVTGEPVEREWDEAEFCRDLDGHPLSPQDAVWAAMHGLVRRVVVRHPDGRVINLGRNQRLFRGAARAAALRATDHCFHPGCDLPARWMQIDHEQPWSHGGPTNPTNGRRGCRGHNRYEAHGFRTRRRPDGTYHVQRPDGTDITQPP